MLIIHETVIDCKLKGKMQDVMIAIGEKIAIQT